MPCWGPVPECSTGWNHAFLKSEKEDVCLTAVHAWSFPWQSDQKASAEQMALCWCEDAPTLLSPNLYFLGRLTCLPLVLISLPLLSTSHLSAPAHFLLPKFSSLALPLLDGLSPQLTSKALPEARQGLVSPPSQPCCDLTLLQGLKCRDGEVTGRDEIQRPLFPLHSQKAPPLRTVQ